MKKITYRELLNMIEEETNPEVVYLYGNAFKWNGYNYLKVNSGTVELLFEKMLEISTDYGLANILHISYQEEILDEKEKEYLKAVVKPFRNRVKTIERIKNKEWERIVVFYKDYDDTRDHVRSYMSLPMFKAGTMYKGMELNKEYTLEELGI